MYLLRTEFAKVFRSEMFHIWCTARSVVILIHDLTSVTVYWNQNVQRLISEQPVCVDTRFCVQLTTWIYVLGISKIN
jgi:hypothetical protein